MATKSSNNKITLSTEQELQILRSVVDIACSEFDLDLILHEIIKTVTEMTKADSVFIYLLDIHQDHLVLMASKTAHKKELRNLVIKAGEGITGWVAQQNKPVAISKMAYKDPRFKGFDVLPEDRYEAFLSLPVVYKGKPIGVINVQHKREHEYSQNTINLIEMIAKQVGNVIEHARLFEETNQKALQFDALVKVSQSITSQDYLDEILNLIVVVTAEMLNSKICSIMLLDEKGKELVIKATQSLSDDYKKKPSIEVSNSLVGQVVTTKKPLQVYDVTKEQKYVYRELAAKEGLTSMLAMPMMFKDKVIGVVSVYTKKPHAFKDQEINVLQLIANQAAVAVENTKLMDEALKAKEALETRKLIERAKGILMKMNHLSEDAAYRLIHKKAMDTCKSMKEIAESVILLADLQKGL